MTNCHCYTLFVSPPSPSVFPFSFIFCIMYTIYNFFEFYPFICFLLYSAIVLSPLFPYIPFILLLILLISINLFIQIAFVFYSFLYIILLFCHSASLEIYSTIILELYLLSLYNQFKFFVSYFTFSSYYYLFLNSFLLFHALSLSLNFYLFNKIRFLSYYINNIFNYFFLLFFFLKLDFIF